MSCYYCWREGITTADQGNCPVCQRDICTPPSTRFDGNFHGEACGCGCDALVCERHLRDHARTHGESDPGACFPALWALVSSGGFGGAAALLADSDGTGRRAVNRFLNTVLPRDSLLQVAEALPGRLAAVKGVGHDAFVRFAPEFYIPATLERTAALAAREMQSAAAGLQRHPERVAWFRAGRRRGAPTDRVAELLAALDSRFWYGFEIPSRTRGRGDRPDVAAAMQAVERNREVYGMEPGELAAWVAAPLAQATGTDAEPVFA